MSKQFLTHITSITIPSLKIDNQGNYFYDTAGVADSDYYGEMLESIRQNDYNSINYAQLKKIAVDYYKSFLNSYFENGLFIQEDNIWSTVNEVIYSEIINDNLKRNTFRIMGGSSNGNVGLRNAMLLIDTNGYDNPTMLIEKSDLKQDLNISFGFQGQNSSSDFKNVIPTKYIKEVMIKDPYLGDIVIRNPNYFKNNELNANDIYNDKINEINLLYSNSQLKGSLKIFNDLIKELIKEIDILKIPNLYKRKLLEYANKKVEIITNELLTSKQK